MKILQAAAHRVLPRHYWHGLSIPANGCLDGFDNLLLVMITRCRLRHLLLLVGYVHFGRAAALAERYVDAH